MIEIFRHIRYSLGVQYRTYLWRRRFRKAAGTFASDIVGVQPLAEATGSVFKMKIRYEGQEDE